MFVINLIINFGVIFGLLVIEKVILVVIIIGNKLRVLLFIVVIVF